MSNDDTAHPGEGDGRNARPGTESEVGRRGFLKVGIGTAATAVAAAAVLEPLRGMSDPTTAAEFFQQHYTRLTPEVMDQVLERIEQRIAREYGAKVNVEDYKPIEGVEYAYALNLSRCNGSRRCVEACMKENNIPPDHTEMAYIRVIELPNDSLNLEDGDVRYKHDTVPESGKYYMPIQCHQCRKPPCVKVCPVQATWTEPDGITVIDYNWCIGCRYCMAGCPYEARRFNWTRPELEPEQINPDMGYLSNRIRPRGVVEKCNFCLHRTRRGLNPACLEVCPTGARVFGNIRDPNDRINYILKTKRVYILKAEANTIPRFYYFFDKE